jgi:asparagine synthase (glutamine-hydrolysing)
MCGIAGLVLKSGGTRQSLARRAQAMNDALAHRGPDGAGLWVDEAAGVALAQRRLAIIDLSETGAQPMISASGRYSVSYNGEIYNFEELRAELQAVGVSFRGSSDTEVLLEGWAHWGAAALVARLNGMFAIAMWDRQERVLTLVRDPFGIKPLVWHCQGGTFLFGSEIKALVADPDCPRVIDQASVAAFLRHGNVPAPWTIYRGVQKLPPGSMLTWRSGAEPQISQYWTPVQAALAGQRMPDSLSLEQASVAGESLIGDAVKRQMVADVPLGAFLSGGIDSSLIVALMQKHSSRKVDTFTIGFEEPAWDESAHADAVARHLGTRHHTLRTSGRAALALVDDLATIYDEPFADSSQLPTLLLSRLVRQHVTVAISGDGGDEAFGGYARHGWGLNLERYQRTLPRPMRSVVARGINALPTAWLDRLMALAGRGGDHGGHKLQRVLTMGATQDFASGYRQMTSLVLAPDALMHVMHERHAQEQHAQKHHAQEHHPRAFDPSVAAGLHSHLTRMQVTDAMGYLPDDILVKVDRASMSVGLEVRVPLLDHRIWEWAMRTPAVQRRAGGVGKVLLRSILARHVPPALFERPKTGFAVPLARWLRGDLRDWAENLLEPATIEACGLDKAAVRSLWMAHGAGTQDNASALWAVLMLASWTRSSSVISARDKTAKTERHHDG